MKRIHELDGLRGIAVLLVIGYHYAGLGPARWNPLHLGWMGVDIFFVLSGFLIGGILIDNQESPAYYSTFYIRRALRILPPYILTAVIFVPLMNKIGRPDQPWYVYATFTQNLVFGFAIILPSMGHFWSLAMEEQFYFCLPIVVRRWKSYLPHLIGFAFIACPLIRVLEWRHWGFWGAAVLPFGRFDMLMAGVLVAMLERKSYSAALPKYLFALSSLAIFIAFMSGVSIRDRAAVTWGYSVILAFAASSLLMVLRHRPAILRWRWLTTIGQQSYTIYLLHVPVRFLVITLNLPPVTMTLISLGATLALARISWLMESRFIERGKSFSYTAEPSPPARADFRTAAAGLMSKSTP